VEQYRQDVVHVDREMFWYHWYKERVIKLKLNVTIPHDQPLTGYYDIETFIKANYEQRRVFLMESNEVMVSLKESFQLTSLGTLYEVLSLDLPFDCNVATFWRKSATEHGDPSILGNVALRSYPWESIVSNWYWIGRKNRLLHAATQVQLCLTDPPQQILAKAWYKKIHGELRALMVSDEVPELLKKDWKKFQDLLEIMLNR